MMMNTHGGGSCSGFGLGFGVESTNERIREFVSSEIVCGILNATLVMFGTIKEGITTRKKAFYDAHCAS